MESVRCPGCGEENPARFRLCGYCGTALVAQPAIVICRTCGEENPAKFRLCGFCGSSLAPEASTGAPPHAPAPVPPAPAQIAPAPIASAPDAPSSLAPGQLPVAAPDRPAPVPVDELPPEEIRKPATFVFVDLRGSTALAERIDAEAMGEIKKRYFGTMASQIERHGGTIEKYIGDAIMAVFGVPRAHEDDALRAVRAAHGMQRALVRLNEELLAGYGVELANRTGVNTGEVVATTDPTANQQLATGDTVNVAARLEQAAPPNEILIGETTFRLVRDWVDVEAVEPLELKGKSERVAAFRVVDVRSTTDRPILRATSAPLVGRGAELAQLRAVYREAVDDGGLRLVSLIGDAGVGKTRLVREFLDAVAAGGARTLNGRCLPYGDGITFWPLADVAREAAGIEPEDTPEVALDRLRASLVDGTPDGPAIVDRLGSVMGLTTTRYPVEELFWAGRRLLEQMAAHGPLAVLVDDIHWAEPTLLDFLVHLTTATSRHVGVVVLCTARRALLERLPAWGIGDRMARIVLDPLGADSAYELVDRMLGEGGVDPAVCARIVAAADGNPLFVEQLVSMLIDQGQLRRDADGAWVAQAATDELRLPPTIQALLAARLDDLTREERAVIEPAAVIGLTFPEPAVAEMAPDAVRPRVGLQLATLDRKQLLQRAGQGDDDDYRFRHLLIRDATYGSLLKRTRARLHERFVAWAERVNEERGRGQEFEEILGYHLEQAYRYRTELGPLDADAVEIGRRAAAKLGGSGRRAFERGDLPAAAGLLRRAVGLLDGGAAGRVELLVELAEVLIERGEFELASAAIDEASAGAVAIGDERLEAGVRLVRLWHGLFTGEIEGGMAAAVAGIEALPAQFEAAGDVAGIARARRLLMVVHGTAGRYALAAESARRAVTAAQAAGDRRIAGRGAIGYATAVLYGPTPASEALATCQALAAQVRDDRKAEATILVVSAVFHAMAGRFEDAAAALERGRARLAELGMSITASTTSLEASRVWLLSGQPERAEAELRRDADALGEIGERYYRSTVVGLLARILAGRGDPGAAAATDLAAELADADDALSQVIWRRARAMVLAGSGELEGAIAVAREAVDAATGTEDRELAGDALSDLATVLELAGRPAEAAAALREAVACYDAKGDTVSAAERRGRLAVLAAD